MLWSKLCFSHASEWESRRKSYDGSCNVSICRRSMHLSIAQAVHAVSHLTASSMVAANLAILSTS